MFGAAAFRAVGCCLLPVFLLGGGEAGGGGQRGEGGKWV